MGRTTLNIEKDTVLMPQSQQQSLFTSNQEEADNQNSATLLRKQQTSFGKSKRYRYINFNDV